MCLKDNMRQEQALQLEPKLQRYTGYRIQDTGYRTGRIQDTEYRTGRIQDKGYRTGRIQVTGYRAGRIQDCVVPLL